MPKLLSFITLTIIDHEFAAFRIKYRIFTELKSMKQAFETGNNDSNAIPEGLPEAY